MPEGDALHRVARALQPLVGDRIAAEAPHPRGAEVAERVDGLVLEAAEAVGKNLVLRFEGGVVVRSHLRMKGRWRVLPSGRRPFGRPWLVLRGETHTAAQWNGPVLELGPPRPVGPDVLADPPDLEAMLANLRAAPQRLFLGEALQRQRLVSGIGNMWMAETLWEARLSPWSSLADTRDHDLRLALETASRLMREGRRERRAYRRAGRPCPRCGEPISSRGQGDANRIAYWCPRCQEGEGRPGE